MDEDPTMDDAQIRCAITFAEAAIKWWDAGCEGRTPPLNAVDTARALVLVATERDELRARLTAPTPPSEPKA